ncbi:MAG: undecaprenyl-phosphate glucose phosphotransferase [Myxococcota bacterium]|nr:undecaprenyl-phosphate glucose phosphotransferase [Myxococcota bacterium]
MLYRHGEVFRSLLMASDLALVAMAWLFAFVVRFHTFLDSPQGIPPLSEYSLALAAILPVYGLILQRQGVYRPKRLGSFWTEAAEITWATTVALVLALSLSFFLRSYSFSRVVVGVFAVLVPVALMGLRIGVRTSLRIARRRGFNRRFALVVGSGRLAEEIIRRIHDHPSSGLHVVGLIADAAAESAPQGIPLLGRYADLKHVLSQRRIDHVIIALGSDEGYRLEKVLADLDDEVVSVMLAPDLLHIATLRSSVENFDGVPIIHLRDSPLVGWASVQKRTVDLVGSGAALLLTGPLLGLLALGVALSSGLPVLYRQKRMGLDGRIFTMLKLRTMRRDAERAGPGWSRLDDPRRTRFGTWLRRFSLDELPQLWNVMKGEMSLVGPRPEQAELIREFRREIPSYMLRHKVKSGMTGWAQVHGLRGDTSLHARIEHDIFYIQNWSLGLDFKIIVMTIWSVLRDRDVA